MVLAGVCTPQERWKVHKALYGFPSSPARWSAHRDSVLKTFQWESDGEGHDQKVGASESSVYSAGSLGDSNKNPTMG